jgi:hypothetical protein
VARYYGQFHGGDPTQFIPDPECSTEEERARHRDAVYHEILGDGPIFDPDCTFVNPEQRNAGGFGLGTGRQWMSDEDYEEMNAGYDDDMDEAP